MAGRHIHYSAVCADRPIFVNVQDAGGESSIGAVVSDFSSLDQLLADSEEMRRLWAEEAPEPTGSA